MAKNEKLNYLELVYYGFENRDGVKYSNFNRHTEINTDREIKICTKCDKVYEVYALGGGNYEQFNYLDFPRYGKQKEKCAECRKLDGEKIFFTCSAFCWLESTFLNPTFLKQSAPQPKNIKN